MIKQASVSQIQRGEVSRKDGYIVIAMCFYPRGMRKELRDEYRRDLAPDRVLFKEWQKYEQEFGHDAAFAKSNYEKRFQLNKENLERLAKVAEEKDVYLVCQCQMGERCHREMLMVAAHELWDAGIDQVFNEYREFSKRLRSM